MHVLPVIAGMLLLGCGAAFAADAIPATSYFPVLPFDAPPDTTPQLVPLAASHPINKAQTGITHAIIAIHDESRDANGAVATLSALAGAANASTIILAPQFLLLSDLARFAGHLPEQGRAFAAWQMAGWAAGDDALSAQMNLADRNLFPDLKYITIAGFGAGGDFVQRYAAFGMAADAVAKQNLDLRYVIAGANSYLYQTANRPLGGRKGFGRPDIAACPDFDAYPFGLEKLNDYARRVGANQAKTAYATRNITYLNSTMPDAMPASTCAALAQGGDSATRARNYQAYLESVYSDVAARTQTFSLAQGADNNAVGLFGSACGIAQLFGDGICAQTFGDGQAGDMK
jgi:hypothetical protein